MKRRTILYVPFLGAVALAIATVALADAPTDVWIEGGPAQTDDDTFEWAEGLPYIIFEEPAAPTPTPTPTPTPYAGPPATLTVTPLGWDGECDIWHGPATLEWTVGLNANGTIIRLDYCDCPETLEEGRLVYEGNGTATTVDIVVSSLGHACFSAWGYNNLGNSTTYTCTCVGGDAMDAIGISLGTLSDMAIIALLFGLPLLLLLYGHRRPNLTIRVPALITAFLAAPLLMPYGLAYAVPIWLLAFGAILRWLIYDIWWSRNWDV